MKKNVDLTKGPILQSLTQLSIPIIFANLLQTAYQLIDALWVGRLGTDAVAAVSLSFPIIFLIISLGSGLSVAGAVLVAQLKGRNDQRQLNHVATQTVIFIAFVSLLITVLGYVFSEDMIKLIGAEDQVLAQATSYLKISFLGTISLFGFFVVQSLLRAVGEVKLPLVIVGITVLLNLIFDPLFIYGWHFIPAYGVGGAAVATFGTQTVALILGLILIARGKHGIEFSLKKLKPDWKLAKQLLMLGFPASMAQSARALGFTLMTALAASFGTVAVATYGVGMRILSFIIIPAIGVSLATETLVGQNIGAGKTSRAEKVGNLSARLILIVLSIIGVVCFVLSKQIVSLFIPGELEVIAEATLLVRLSALTFGFIGVQQVVDGVFRGSGNTGTSMVLAVGSLLVLQIPLAYGLAYYTSLGLRGIWWAFPITNSIAVVLTWLWYKRGGWKQTEILDKKSSWQKMRDVAASFFKSKQS